MISKEGQNNKLKITAFPLQRTGWLQMSQKTDLGFLLLVELAKEFGSGDAISLRKVAERNGISFYYLQKVAADLRKAGIVESGRGKKGGYRLAKVAEEITVKDIVEAHEGPLKVMKCLDPEHSCFLEKWCHVRPGLNFINKTIVETLSQITLNDFIHPTSWKRQHRKLTLSK